MHAGAWVGLSRCNCGSTVRSFGHWATANCAAPPTASAGQYTTSNCKPHLFGFPCKWRYINVGTFNPLTFNIVREFLISSSVRFQFYFVCFFGCLYYKFIQNCRPRCVCVCLYSCFYLFLLPFYNIFAILPISW